MSKGTTMYSLRIPEATIAAIDAAVARSLTNRRQEPYTRSSWILAAILEKLAHMARSRKANKEATQGESPSDDEIVIVKVGLDDPEMRF